MALVSGYDSDSASEGEEQTIVKPRGLSSLLPPPSSSSQPASVVLSKVSTSVPSQKRRSEKRQIRIDTLESVQGGDNEEDVTSKRPKVEAANGSGAGPRGLMGLLPAPKQQGSPPPPRLQGDNGTVKPANGMGIAGGSEGRLSIDMASTTPKTVKGNNDFRAMLGLKPSNLPSRAKDTEAKNTEVTSAVVRTIAAEKKQVAKMIEGGDGQANSEFFALPAMSTVAPLQEKKPTFTISTAPEVEDVEEQDSKQAMSAAAEEDFYKGWQQGPDGNWFPVTPEAHAAYTEYLVTQGNQTHLEKRPEDMQIGDANSIQSIDANTSRDAWLSRPSSQVDSASSNLDRKYALAAASMATPDQGVPLIDQEEEVKKMDKKTNFRAKRKGQLSSLIAQAEENREKLEEKWSKRKDGRNSARQKYGF